MILSDSILRILQPNPLYLSSRPAINFRIKTRMDPLRTRSQANTNSKQNVYEYTYICLLARIVCI